MLPGCALTPTKMKSGLAASIYRLSAGRCWVNSRSALSSRSISATFDRRHDQIDCSFDARLFVSSHRAVHSSALEDDAFSELGDPESVCGKPDDFVDDDVFSELDTGISKCSTKKIQLVTEKTDAFLNDDAFSELGPGISDSSAKQLKLVTEKHDHFLHARCQNTHSHRREASKPFSSDHSSLSKELFDVLRYSSTMPPVSVHASRSTDIKESTSKAVSSDHKPDTKRSGVTTKASITSSTKLRSPDHETTSNDDTKKISEMKYPLSVSVKNIPSEVGLPALVEAISVFGQVSGASFVTTSDKFKSCTIEFENAESSRRATLTGKILIGNHVFPVTSLDALDLVVVRIKNIKETTSDSTVHSICKSAGELVGLTRTSNNSIDAFFNVRNRTCHHDIVKRLNSTVFDLNHWSASIPNSSKVPSEKEARYKLNSQIINRFFKLNMELRMKSIHMSDLEYLSACLMHIQH